MAVRAPNDESFGALPWVTVLFSALVMLIAYLLATR